MVNDAAGETSDEWFYTERGQRKGPISATALKNLLKTQQLENEVQVWRKGLKNWLPIQETELGGEFEHVPPIAPSLIKNGLVWTVALLPIAYGIMNSAFVDYVYEHPYEDFTYLNLLRWTVVVLANGALCFLDEQRLDRAGHGSSALKTAALFLVPVYLFMRASKLKQRPYYGFVWIVCFVFMLVVSGARR
jgi:hypothetical protein